MNETTWGHGGYGEAGSGLVSRLRNKKVCKGGQTVLVSDAGKYFRPRAYQHRHKLHAIVTFPNGTKLTKAGTRELHDLAVELLSMVVDGNDAGKKTIFCTKPCITVDNYFIDDKILNWCKAKIRCNWY